MVASSLLEFVAREHPAIVHLPLGLVATLPLALGVALFRKRTQPWQATALFIAALGWLGSFGALFSGVLWGRQINLIPTSGFLPVVASEKQVLQNLLRWHELTALGGLVLGALCLGVLVLAWRRSSAPGAAEGRGALRLALILSLLWLGTWGTSGKLGGTMVFGNEALNKAAAEADAARRNDQEADLPIRALDFASLEPVTDKAVRSPAHGNRWRRIWVTASGLDAYKAGRPLPVGAYAVMTTYSDEKGRPGTEPGPLYMKEAKADGGTAFAFYWPRIPENQQKEFGGKDSLYWRSPDPQLAICRGCHEKNP